MAFIVIAGMPGCPKYAHAKYMGDFLSSNLPNFNVHNIPKKKAEWKVWLKKTCEANNWHHYKCPIIWKELAMHGGRGILIGGLSDFLEYCFEYYGLTTILTDEQKQVLIMDNLELYRIVEEKKKQSRVEYKTHQICISVAHSPIISMLVGELLRLDCLRKKEGTTILLFDKPSYRDQLAEVVQDAAAMGSCTGLGAARIVDSLANGLRGCDTFIVLGGIERSEALTIEDWLSYNCEFVMNLADMLNEHAPRNCRVILAGPNTIPLCYNATLLCEAAIGLRPRNIVVVSADLGLEPLITVADATNTKIEDFASPVVWGFIGINHLIDLNIMLHKASYFLPNKRALKKIPGSTLLQGEVITEIRHSLYLLDKVPDIWLHVSRRREEASRLLGRAPNLMKVRAIIGLLQQWYSKDYDGEVISLGVLSNGSFDFPHGIVLSQPAVLKNGFWEPCSNFPQPQDEHCELKHICTFGMHILDKYGIGQRFVAEWLLPKVERELITRGSLRDEAQMSRARVFQAKDILTEMMDDIQYAKERNDAKIENYMAKYDFETKWIQEMADADLTYVLEEVWKRDPLLLARPPKSAAPKGARKKGGETDSDEEMDKGSDEEDEGEKAEEEEEEAGEEEEEEEEDED